MKAHILVVDDDRELCTSIRACLEEEGMTSHGAGTGQEVLSLLGKYHFDVILLDLILPDMDGFEILKGIRDKDFRIPVIIISSRSKTHQKITGLELGADDYMTKPFDIDELISRIKVQIRRSQQEQTSSGQKIMSYYDLKLDLTRLRVFKREKEIILPARLIKLLICFMQHTGWVLSKEQIYTRVWDDTYFDENTLMVYISKLRKLIEDNPSSPHYIHTMKGLGYKFEYTPAAGGGG